MKLKVVTFNMQFGQVWDPADPDNAPVDLERTIAELRRLDADIMLLQEVEQVEADRRQICPSPNFTRLRAAFPEHDAYFAYPPQDQRELPFGYGLAIFSRTPLSDCETITLPAPDVEFDFLGTRTQPTQRIIIGARTRVGGELVQLYNTHLQAFFMIRQTSDAYRAQRDIVAAALRRSKIPTLLGGDFNAAPDESTVEQMEAEGYRTAQRSEPTWLRMPFVLDHLFYSTRHFDLDACQVIETDASDHKLLVGEFLLRGARADRKVAEQAGAKG